LQRVAIIICLSFSSWFLISKANAVPIEYFEIESVEIEGANRSDHNWLVKYLDLEPPAKISHEQIITLKMRLLTTKVFSAVDIQIAPIKGSQKYKAIIIVKEKWTLMPVLRGAIGGGTPLAVVGFHNIHFGGKLKTLGMEARKYGSASISGVAYWRDYEFLDQYYLGSEVWKLNRTYSIFDQKQEIAGEINYSVTKARFGLLTSINQSPKDKLKFGLDVAYLKEGISKFEYAKNYAGAFTNTFIDTNDEPLNNIFLLSSLVYDDMNIENLNTDGNRVTVSAGPQMTQSTTHSKWEVEYFGFKYLPFDINAAAHLFVGSNSSSSIGSQYFLGGFESIRGYPDGFIFGSKTAYSNFEVRKLMRTFSHVWFQPTAFLDVGMAQNSWKNMEQTPKSSAGMGIRISSPNIYRAVLRIDYAWSLDGSGQQGITAGMNQFFQPYRPL